MATWTNEDCMKLIADTTAKQQKYNSNDREARDINKTLESMCDQEDGSPAMNPAVPEEPYTQAEKDRIFTDCKTREAALPTI